MLSPTANRRNASKLELHLATFKAPIGYLRAAELLLCVTCIVLVSRWGLTLDYSCRTADNITHYQTSLNTFRLSTVQFSGCDGEERTLWHMNDDATPNVGFFYFVTSFGILYSVLVSVVYVFFWSRYIAHEAYVILDLFLSFLLTVFFMICSCVWWGGVNTVVTATSEHNMLQLFSENAGFWALDPTDMTFERSVNNWTLNLSVVILWGMFLCFCLNIYYIARGLFRKVSNDDDSMI